MTQSPNASHHELEPLLRLTDVAVQLSGRPILSLASISVERGELVGVYGASGSGKSTLLRAVAGLVPLAGGIVALDGHDLSAKPVNARDISFMQQSFPLYSNLSVRENILVSRRGADIRDFEKSAISLLKRTGLSADTMSRRPESLSGGEMQRVALVKALARRASVYLFDEPLSNVDKSRRDEINHLIRERLLATAAGAVYVSHSENDLAASCDRVVFLGGGKLHAGIALRDISSSDTGQWVLNALAFGSFFGLQVIAREYLADEVRNEMGSGGILSPWLGWRAESATARAEGRGALPADQLLLARAQVKRLVHVGSTRFAEVAFGTTADAPVRWVTAEPDATMETEALIWVSRAEIHFFGERPT